MYRKESNVKNKNPYSTMRHESDFMVWSAWEVMRLVIWNVSTISEPIDKLEAQKRTKGSTFFLLLI